MKIPIITLINLLGLYTPKINNLSSIDYKIEKITQNVINNPDSKKSEEDGIIYTKTFGTVDVEYTNRLPLSHIGLEDSIQLSFDEDYKSLMFYDEELNGIKTEKDCVLLSTNAFKIVCMDEMKKEYIERMNKSYEIIINEVISTINRE